MKRIALMVTSLAAILFTAGCGKGHDDRDVKHDVKAVTHDAATDVNRAAHDARQAAHDLTQAAESAAIGTASDVRQAAAQIRDDLRPRDAVIRARADDDYNRPVDPAELREEAKRDAVNAVGAAAQEAAAKFLKSNK